MIAVFICRIIHSSFLRDEPACASAFNGKDLRILANPAAYAACIDTVRRSSVWERLGRLAITCFTNGCIIGAARIVPVSRGLTMVWLNDQGTAELELQAVPEVRGSQYRLSAALCFCGTVYCLSDPVE